MQYHNYSPDNQHSYQIQMCQATRKTSKLTPTQITNITNFYVTISTKSWFLELQDLTHLWRFSMIQTDWPCTCHNLDPPHWVDIDMTLTHGHMIQNHTGHRYRLKAIINKLRFTSNLTHIPRCFQRECMKVGERETERKRVQAYPDSFWGWWHPHGTSPGSRHSWAPWYGSGSADTPLWTSCRPQGLTCQCSQNTHRAGIPLPPVLGLHSNQGHTYSYITLIVSWGKDFIYFIFIAQGTVPTDVFTYCSHLEPVYPVKQLQEYTVPA